MSEVEYLDLKVINENLEKQFYHVVRRAEDRYRSQLSELASRIIERDHVKVVLLSGPS